VSVANGERGVGIREQSRGDGESEECDGVHGKNEEGNFSTAIPTCR
jgi:hypothetical protein